MDPITPVPGPGTRVAELRKLRGWVQTRLARAAGISPSLLGKIERGERALTQGAAASIAQALGVPLPELLGTMPVPMAAEDSLKALQAAVRRFDLPGSSDVTESALRADLAEMVVLRGDADLRTVLKKLPKLVNDSQDFAHSVGTPEAWAMVSQAYSAVYWLAARHRWMVLADLAVTKQKLAAQQADPMSIAIAARDEAGVYLNHGEFDHGLSVVDRAIVQVESSAEGRERAYALGMLHLRGLTLAGRAHDGPTADTHIGRALTLSQEFDHEMNVSGIHFGPENSAVHIIATSGDLSRHKQAIKAMDELERQGKISLPATRISPLHMNIARSQFALGRREEALEHLEKAWAAAPQLAKIHPTSQEMLRVLASHHKRSNPRLTRIARLAEVKF